MLALLALTDAALVRPPVLSAVRASPYSSRSGLLVAVSDSGAPQGSWPSDTIFTLKKRNDGWDDIRSAIEEFQADRRPAIEELKQKAEEVKKAPVVRWTQVIASELTGTVVPRKASAPKDGKTMFPSLMNVLLSPEEEKAILSNKKYKTDRQRQVALNMRRLAALIPEKK
ncbi:hypothetical protein AB1Y20_014596 [Prymnesium parvum]|uniref:Uncharacterized protein n=1 Tax=Prymnesium parvum TaxID=97485 RepID=A0AB34IE21_PRYPA